MKLSNLLFLLIVVIITNSCSKVPITERKQLNMLPESELISMSKEQYSEFLATHRVIASSDARAKRVENVGHKMRKVVEDFLAKENQSKRVEGFEWEFKLVEDEAVNAWCMPGGKVVVYTGIMELASDDDFLATVMGHEIAHAIARHGNERMSQALALNGLGSALGGAMGENPTLTKQILLQSVGIGSSLGTLAFSRKNESEADKLGLVFMYLAGYDPNKAVGFWEKMAALGGGGPQILSTHPSSETRIEDIKKFIPDIPRYAN